MKSLKTYIFESDKKKKKEPVKKTDIMFTIWEEPDKKVSWIKNNHAYQKIEYKYENYKDYIFMDFLLGYQEDSWRLWAGKVGSCSYDDDPYCNLNTDKFDEAIMNGIDKIEELVQKVMDEPANYVQFYKENPKDAGGGSEGGDDAGGDDSEGGDEGGGGGGLL